MNPALSAYLRSLWNITPTLLDITEPQSTRPFLSPLGMHLPLHAPADVPQDHWFQAAAAHAAAHLVFSQHRFDPAGLRPFTQALVGALEDARVEWLASRELPGLRRLWLPFHAVRLTDTPSFEDLLRRLARCLLDPSHHDPHPWVMKGRQLFFVDDAGDMLALRQPEALRHAASLLGNDVGQMRMQFNARLYEVMPSYRDDNSCLWPADERRANAEHEIASTPQGGAAAGVMQPTAPAVQRHSYPEWDRLVPMYRPHWCAVHDAPARAADTSSPAMRMPCALPRPSRERVRLTAQPDGDELDLDAVVDARVTMRSGQAAELRVYRRTEPRRTTDTTLLLIDTSASTAGVMPALQSAALALERNGPFAIHSFCSDGRHAVHYERVKDFDDPLDASCIARLMGLRSRLSTRLGAALRHATHLIAARRGTLRRVLLLTDGKPHDVDVFDPHYLLADAKQAVLEAARRRVSIECLCVEVQALRALRSVFGARLRHLRADTR
jgi:nitric oxide reductase NorD protein